MSKIRHPSTEASVTCGFFNSVNDRKYDATHMSAIFDGIIKDGIFASIGDCLVVSASSGNTVSVGTGKCWFNHTWTLNDAPLLVECDAAEVLQTRIDAIVVEINSGDDVRDNSIVYKKGVASEYNPTKPTLTKSKLVNEYALCYIRRQPGSTEITQADIENAVGTTETPFVTGILQTVSLDTLLGQWRAELDEFVADEESDFNSWYAEMQQLMSDVAVELNTWTAAEKTTIINWFNDIKDQLSTDQAVNLQLQIDASDVERYLTNGLSDGTKTISDDGTSIKTIDSKGRVLTKTFTNNWSTITSTLYNRELIEYLPYPYQYTTMTKNGLTFTVNNDRTVTVNGTATSVTQYALWSSKSEFLFPSGAGVLSMSGCPAGGSATTYKLEFVAWDGTYWFYAVNDYGYGTTIDTTQLTSAIGCHIGIRIESGTTLNNLVFNPTITNGVSVLGTLVKNISTDGKTITSTLTNNAGVQST